MIKVLKTDKNSIKYSCECGTSGVCTVKPTDGDAALVIDVKCLNCQETERITILQYSTEEGKIKMLDNMDDVELTWSPALNEEI